HRGVVGCVVRRAPGDWLGLDEDVSLSRVRSRNTSGHAAHRGLAGRPSGRAGRASALALGMLAGAGPTAPEPMTEIRSNTVLPAERRAVTLDTADNMRLVGELALPEGRPPETVLVCLHPLPTEGGMMDSHLFRKA